MPAEHGTRSRYTQGCRCPNCTKANRDYMRGYNRRQVQVAGQRFYVSLPVAEFLHKFGQYAAGRPRKKP